MDAELALADDRQDVLDPRPARVVYLQRTPGDVATVEDREHQRVENALVLSVERAVYEDAVTVPPRSSHAPTLAATGRRGSVFGVRLASGSSGGLPAPRRPAILRRFGRRACLAHRNAIRLGGVLDRSSRLAHILHHTPGRAATKVTTAQNQQILNSRRARTTATRNMGLSVRGRNVRGEP